MRVGSPEHGRGFLEVVVWDLDEQVVDLVGADVVDQVVGPAVVAIHRAQVSTNEIPFVVGVPGHVLILEKIVQRRLFNRIFNLFFIQ